MKPWPPLDEDLAAKVQGMVEQALEAERSWAMALEVIRQAMQWADQLIEVFESVNPLPRPIVCQPGCSYCCHNQVEVTPPEAFLLGQVISQFFSPRKLERLKEKAAVSAALKVGKTREELAASRQERPCPLLEQDRCAAYPWRPLMCRAMHSLDREHCRQSLVAGDLSSDEYHLHRYVFTFSMVRGLMEGFRRAGCQPGTLELSQALRDVLLEPRLGERWLRGEEVFPRGSV